MGGWCETCSVKKAIRTGSSADTGGAVDDVERAETRESFEFRADGIDSTEDAVRCSMAGELQLRMESKPPMREAREEFGLPAIECGERAGIVGDAVSDEVPASST